MECRNGVFVHCMGNGPPVLLLHGFPETHLMWRDIGPALSRNSTVIAADLPGYGRSRLKATAPLCYSKREMAVALHAAMLELGHERFAVVGHDRGARVAYRMALDMPQVVSRLAVLDAIPTSAVWDRADARLMMSFWPFSLLAQPAPFPERLLGAAPDAFVDAALGNWGTPASTFPESVRAAYVEALKEPSVVHAICQEYRAAASVDRQHDRDDADHGRRIACPVLALWSANGGLAEWYEEEGGALGIWRQWADNVSGGPMPGGHFFPEEHPIETARRLEAFLLD